MHEHQEDQKTILLVEDEALIAVMEKQTLNKHGFNVITASNGEKAIEAVNTNPNIDLILMDINLGKGMDGTEAAQIILKGKDIPILFLSSYTQPEVVQKTEKISSYGYVTKDSGETVLITSIKMAFRLYKAHSELKKHEKTLEESEEKYRTVVEQTQDGVYIYRGNRFVFVNSRISEFTGYSEEELYAMDLWNLVHPDDKEYVAEIAQKRARGEDTPLTYETRIISKDHKVHYLEMAVSLIKYKGDYTSLGTARDITERKKAEQTLHRSERTFRALLDAAPDAAFLLDTEGTYLAINEMTATRLGKSADALLGTCAYEFVDTDVAQKRRTLINEVVTSGKPIHFVDQRDGLSLENRLYPIFGAEKRVEMVAVYSRDITENKLIEEELQFAYTRLEAIWDIAKIIDYDFRAICDKILSEIVVITKSEYGFFGFISDDESTMTIHSWSGEAMKDCSMVDKPQHYHISEAGVWAEAIRQRKPFILNDYIIPHGAKKGYPDGHVTLTNLMVVPIFSGSRIVSVAAVANKAVSYNDGDINEITAFASSAQSIIERKRTEEQLLKNIERLDMAQIAAQAGVWDWEIPTGHIEWSKHMFHLLGLDPLKNTVSFETWKSIIHTDDIEIAGLRIDQALQQQTVLNSDYRVVMPDGQIRWINAVGQGKYDNNGNPIRMIGFCMDITERKRMEEALKESEAHLNMLIDAMPDLVWLKDDKGVYLNCNQRLAQVFGTMKEEIIGKTDYNFVDKTLADFLRGKDAEAIASGKPSRNEEEITFADRHTETLETIKTPLYTDKRQLLGVLGIGRDITERKQTEEALRDSEQRFYNAFEYASIGKALVSPEGKWLKVNRAVCDMLGYSEQELLSKTFQDITHPDDLDTDLAYVEQMLSGSIPTYQMEKRYLHKNGHIVWVLLSVSLVCNRYGIPDYFISQIVDITDRKLAEDKIKSLLAEKELLLKEVHHRIKNNMNVINSLLTLQAGTLKDPSAIAALKDSGSRVRSMMTLYDKLYQSAVFNIISVLKYIPSLVDEIVANFPNSTSVKIEKKIDDFVLDAKRLQPLGIIINELLTNIMKYAFTGRDDGSIMVSATLTGNRVSLVIEDNGNGMPESIDFENSPGFGLMLVGIPTKQLEGTIRIERKNGTRIILEFEI